MRRYIFIVIFVSFLFSVSVSAAESTASLYVDVYSGGAGRDYVPVLYSSHFEQSFWWTDSSNVSDIRLTFSLLKITIPYARSSGNDYTPVDCKLHLVTGGRDYIIDAYRLGYDNTAKTITFYYASSQYPIYIFTQLYDVGRDDGNRSNFCIFYAELIFDDVSLANSSSGNVTYSKHLTCTLSYDMSGTYNMTGVSSVDARDPVVNAVDQLNTTITDQREEDRTSATNAGNDVSQMMTQVDSQVRSKWEILWYPITFTEQVLTVFSGGTSAASYSDTYDRVVGYTYEENSGLLIPVYDMSRSYDARSSGGTTITFPSFSMMGFQIWDEYSYDLSQLKSDFSTLFNLLYVAITILELYWFVGFLRDKYEEVFG